MPNALSSSPRENLLLEPVVMVTVVTDSIEIRFGEDDSGPKGFNRYYDHWCDGVRKIVR